MAKRNLEPFNNLHAAILRWVVPPQRESVDRMFAKALNEYLRVTPETPADIRENLRRATPKPSPGDRMRRVPMIGLRCEKCKGPMQLRPTPDPDVHPDIWICFRCGAQLDADITPVGVSKYGRHDGRRCPECGATRLDNVAPVGTHLCLRCGYRDESEKFEPPTTAENGEGAGDVTT